MARPTFQWPLFAVSVPVVLVTSLCVAYAVVLASTLAMSGGLDSSFDEFDEIFGRTFLAAAVASLGLILVRQGIWDRLREGPRWGLVLAVAGTLGMVTSALDPVNSISSENNVIRYWTAGFLIWSGVALLAGALLRSYPLLHRILAAALGFLALLAAADELLEFHEALGNTLKGEVPVSAPVNSQDLTTLFVAVVGLLCAISGYFLIRFLDRYPGLRLAPNVRLAAKLFIVACPVFLCAMLLDSFDVYFQQWVNSLLAAVLGEGSRIYAFFETHDLIIRASNCLEEFLELGTAALLVACGMTFLRQPSEPHA